MYVIMEMQREERKTREKTELRWQWTYSSSVQFKALTNKHMNWHMAEFKCIFRAVCMGHVKYVSKLFFHIIFGFVGLFVTVPKKNDYLFSRQRARENCMCVWTTSIPIRFLRFSMRCGKYSNEQLCVWCRKRVPKRIKRFLLLMCMTRAWSSAHTILECSGDVRTLCPIESYTLSRSKYFGGSYCCCFHCCDWYMCFQNASLTDCHHAHEQIVDLPRIM